MFVLDLLLLPLGAVIFPNPRVERVFIHAKVTRGLGNGLIRLDGQLHRAFLKCSGILFRSGLTHRTHLLGCVLSLVSVCPEEYSHIIVCFCGGGIRGLLSATILEDLAHAYPNILTKTHLFAGTSTGAGIISWLLKGD